MAHLVLCPLAQGMIGRILRTGISGVMGAVLDLIALILLVEVARVPVGWAAFAAAGVGAVVAFTLSKFWAFRDRSPIEPRQVGAYALVALVNATFTAFSVHFLAVTVRITYLLAKGIAAALVFVFWSYPAQARLVFRGAPILERRLVTRSRSSQTHHIQVP